MELFPAILIGGPPHSGKSVLAYSLTQALRAAGVEHYLLRAYPDGEGDWANEADQEMVRRIRVKGALTPALVERIGRDIARRHLPLLVDVGGRPTSWQEAIFSHCTHAILLAPDPEGLATWREIAGRRSLVILAELHSSLSQAEVVWEEGVTLRGVIHGLERGATAAGPTFAALLKKITPLLAYEQDELRRAHRAMAPLDLVIELESLRRTLGGGPRWSPAQLPALLDYLPSGSPLALYDRAPNWLYAALALHAWPGRFYQFDPRLGWVAPPELAFGPIPAASPLQAQRLPLQGYDRLEIRLAASYLDYSEADGLTLSPVSSERGLVLSGKLPLWLWTALARLYRPAQWLGVYQPQLGIVIVRSAAPEMGMGKVIEAAEV